MTVFEQHTHELFQAACKKIVEPEQFYKNCKLKIFCVIDYGSQQKYEDAINEFMSTHYIVDMKFTQSNVSYFAYVFYKDEL